MKKMKELLSEVFEDEQVKVNPREVTKSVREYSQVGKKLYGGMNMIEVAKSLSKIAEDAHNHILGESDDWFDKVTINRNMKSLNTMVQEFKKTAKEYHTLSERLTSLYEDMGGVLNRYYEINEDTDFIDDKEANTKFDDLKDKDVDNDGDVDDSDSYLHKKLGTVAKKDESVKEEIGGVISTPAIGYYKR